MKNRPKGKGLKRARKKLERLTSRNARPRTLRKLAQRVVGLAALHAKRLTAWRAQTSA